MTTLYVRIITSSVPDVAAYTYLTDEVATLPEPYELIVFRPAETARKNFVGQVTLVERTHLFERYEVTVLVSKQDWEIEDFAAGAGWVAHRPLRPNPKPFDRAVADFDDDDEDEDELTD